MGRLFLRHCRPNGVVLERRYGAAFLTSLATHASMLGIALVTIRVASDRPRDLSAADGHAPSLIWLPHSGAGRGGGGGGDDTPDRHGRPNGLAPIA